MKKMRTTGDGKPLLTKQTIGSDTGVLCVTYDSWLPMGGVSTSYVPVTDAASALALLKTNQQEVLIALRDEDAASLEEAKRLYREDPSFRRQAQAFCGPGFDIEQSLFGGPMPALPAKQSVAASHVLAPVATLPAVASKPAVVPWEQRSDTERAAAQAALDQYRAIEQRRAATAGWATVVAKSIAEQSAPVKPKPSALWATAVDRANAQLTSRRAVA